MESTDSQKNTHEIDILALIMSVLREWKTLFKFCVVFGFLGIIVALCVKKTYTASVILAPETSTGSAKIGDISGLASSFGVNLSSLGSLGSSEDAITPLIYPNLFASLDFLLPLQEISVMEKGSDSVMTYERHIFGDKKEKKTLLQRIKGIFIKQDGNGSSVESRYVLDYRQERMYRYLSKKVGCLTDKKTDIITINVMDHDPLVAAIVVDTIQSRLQQYIIDYRTKKARNDYEYYSMLLQTARDEYEEARREYIAFAETHKGVTQKSYMLTDDYLESEMEQKYMILTQLQMQVHSCIAKIQESTPAFAVIQKSYVPFKASSMSRSQMVVLSGFIGFLFGAVWVAIGRKLFAKIRRKQ